MIKRNVKNGSIVTSTTERLPPTTIPINDSKTTLVGEAPKQPVETEKTEKKVPVVVEQVALEPEQDEWFRTCNCCLAEDKEEGFVTCKDCADYDLCMSCITDNVHGHHASHTFEVACASHKVSEHIERLMKPGRNVAHSAICDKCDKYIFGVRHKCLDCPDWDLCNGCVDLADAIHPNHRFVPIYDSKTCARVKPESIKYFQVHTGIYCDGPLCFEKHLLRQNIEGERYKCAVCDDFDLCANCEASPLNTHNVTHPVIKFRTPVRSVIVNTTGNHDDGKPLPMMGDKVRCTRKTSSKCTGTTAVPSANASTQVQTTADMQPKVETEKEGTEKEVRAEDAKIVKEEVEEPRMEADFVRDVIQDGSVFPPNVVFEQTWYLRNTGNEYWPAGCSVKFIGGDNMCANDPDHPASVHELVSAAESTTCYSEVSPGQEHGFTVLMRSPQKAGRAISYWRLTGPDGLKFDHKLWCDITVEESDIPVQKTADVVEKDVKNEKNESEHSQLVFPALVKESPVESVHENTTESVAEAAADVPPAYEDDLDDFASVGDDHSSSDGFLTDEEYDILDASDQEFSEMN